MITAYALLMQVLPAAADERPCRADIEKFCADVKPGAGRLAECLRKHYAELSPVCKARGEEVRERVEEAHEACREDVAKYCKEVKPGEGRILSCLKKHDKGLSAACTAAMKPAR